MSQSDGDEDDNNNEDENGECTYGAVCGDYVVGADDKKEGEFND